MILETHVGVVVFLKKITGWHWVVSFPIWKEMSMITASKHFEHFLLRKWMGRTSKSGKLHCVAYLVYQEGRGACGYLMGYNCSVGPFLRTSFENTDLHIFYYCSIYFVASKRSNSSKKGNKKLPRTNKILLGCMFQSNNKSQNQYHLVKLGLYSIR